MPGSIKALRIHNLLLGGGLSGAQLETELSNAMSAGAFTASLRQRTVVAAMAGSVTAMAAVIASPSAMTAVAGSPTAMTAVAVSSTAMTAVAASSAAMTAIAASSTAMTAVAASSPAMAVCLGNTVARAAFYNSDIALAAIAASSTAKAAMRAASTYLFLSVVAPTAGVAVPITGITVPCLMVGWSCIGSGNITLTGRRAGSTIGTLTIGGEYITGNTAEFDNVMAITSPATIANSIANRTHYFGIVPV